MQVKTIMGYRKSENVKISLISMLPKVTNLLINLDFIQQEAISDVILPATYKIAFVDEEGEIISNLVAVDAETRMEVLRHEVIIDISFADDFGFDI